MRSILFTVVGLLLFAPIWAQNPNRLVKSSAETYLELQKLAKPTRVLYVAAHPDDENTRVISWLENYRHVETAYFSFTRGDGGQNLIGTEKGDLLGILRTQELLEARKKDGAIQFFSHATDFGYSKSSEETLEIWDEDLVLGDIVYAIRYFKPDIIITRFPPNAEAGHGHHAASAILAAKAFDLSGDKNAFPEQVKVLGTWQAMRLMWNSYSWRRDPNKLAEDVKIKVSESVPLLGYSTSEIASRARSMHRCQGFGRSWDRGEVFEYFKHTKGSPFTNDILEGINTSWSRFSEGRLVDQAFAKLFKNYNFLYPWQNVDELAAVYKALNKIPENDFSAKAKDRVRELMASSVLAHIEASSTQKSVAPGDSLSMTLEAVAFENIKVGLNAVKLFNGDSISIFKNIGANQAYEKNIKIKVPETTKLSTPYWLEHESSFGNYNFKDNKLLQIPESKDQLWVEFELEISGITIPLQTPVYHKRVEPDFGEIYQHLPVLAPVIIELKEELIIAINGQKSTINFSIANNSNVPQKRVLDFTLPKGWSCDNSKINLDLAPNEKREISIAIAPAENAINGDLKFFWRNSEQPVLKLREVKYDHILTQTIQTGANIKLANIAVKTSGKKIGYIPGAGDEIPEILGSLGYPVTIINEENWSSQNLSEFKTIITGIRAYNTQEWLAAKSEELWDYAKKGGHLLVQYNTLNFLSSIKAPIAPSELQIGRSRVTKEDAEMDILKPQHPVFNRPNQITQDDFSNWVQERGLYFAESWSTDFTPLLSMNDPDENPAQGALLVGDFGKGHISYCAISFFRQLPAGVPGAYRLFVNLVEL